MIIIINTLFPPDESDQINGNIQLMERTKQKHNSSYYSFYKDSGRQKCKRACRRLDPSKKMLKPEVIQKIIRVSLNKMSIAQMRSVNDS